jgi:hypothetical protein
VCFTNPPNPPNPPNPVAREEEEHTINKKLYPILAVLLKVKTKKSQGLGFGEKQKQILVFFTCFKACKFFLAPPGSAWLRLG